MLLLARPSALLLLLHHNQLLLQFDDDFVAKKYPQFESAADLRQSLVSSTSLARMKDVEARIQDAIVTQVGVAGFQLSGCNMLLSFFDL
jgi:hypothetical protein